MKEEVVDGHVVVNLMSDDDFTDEDKKPEAAKLNAVKTDMNEKSEAAEKSAVKIDTNNAPEAAEKSAVRHGERPMRFGTMDTTIASCIMDRLVP